MKAIDAALQLAEVGTPIFPCRPDKKPYVSGGFKAATTDAAIIRDWWTSWPDALIARPTGNGLVVIDCDHDPEKQPPKDGEMMLPGVEAQYGELPATYTVGTRRGGGHRYFRVPADVRCPCSTDKVAYGIDVRGDGGYVIIPPSPGYDVMDDGPEAELPSMWLELLRHKSTKQSESRERDTERDRTRALNALELIPADCDRDTWLRIGMALHDGGLSYEDFDRWSATGGARYQGADDTRKTWDSFKPGGGVSLGTLFDTAKKHGWREFRHTSQESESGARSETAYTRNDAGAALLFIDRYESDVRHVTRWDTWLGWNGSRWVHNDEGMIYRMALDLSRDEVARANEIENAEARFAAIRRAVGLGNAARIEAMLKLARYDSRIALDFSLVDADPWLIGAPNGVIDLRTGQLRQQARSDYVTQTVAVSFDPYATCPRWEQFILEIMGGDPALAAFMQKAAGYCLSGSVTEHVFFFLHGTGANGKSTYCETIQSVMSDYAQRAGDSLIRQSDNGRDPAHEIADLFGSRVVFSSEVADGMRLNEKLIKDISGGDTLKARRLYQSPFQYRPQFKLWIFGNHMPRITGTDDGIWRRVRLIPFLVQFDGNRKDPTLPGKLAAELPGILAWMVRGCLRWQAEGLTPPALVTNSTADYRTEEDVLAQFIQFALQNTPGTRVERTAIFSAYLSWAEHQGVRHTWTARRFNRLLRERGWRDKNHGGTDYWVDTTLNPQAVPPPWHG